VMGNAFAASASGTVARKLRRFMGKDGSRTQ
jgi:hypothetical protein